MSTFNDKAKNWDTSSKVSMNEIFFNNIRDKINHNQIDILDIGCGTGLLAFSFKEIAKSLIGIDTSKEMLKKFEEKIKSRSIKNYTALLEDVNELKFTKKFDLIVSSMTFHHLKDPGQIINKLKTFLNPNGNIFIFDLDKENGDFHSEKNSKGVLHYGFDEATCLNWDKTAIREIVYTITKDDQREYPIFMLWIK